MPLFKYLAPERIDVVASLSLRYTQPAAFNDPFEAKPHYTGMVSPDSQKWSYPRRYDRVLLDQYLSMSKVFRDQMSLEAFAIQMEFIREEVYEIFETVDASFVPVINLTMHEAFGEKMGALSLSELNDNQLMWSHYADGHKGFLLEFDDQHAYFTNPNGAKGDIWALHKIQYAQERPQTTVIEFDIQAILLTKHASWMYECEWKHFRPLNQANLVVGSNPFPIHLFRFPADCLRSITFGSRTSPSLRNSLVTATKANPDLVHLRYYQAELDSHSYKLSVKNIL